MTSWKSSRVGGQARLDDLVRVLHRLTTLDLVDVLHARRHLAPDRVLVVEERGIIEADEELAIGGIRAGGAGHRGGAPNKWLLFELRLLLLAGPARTGGLR